VPSDAQPGQRVPIGALVERVQPGGPAMRAGLVRGDLIVGFDRERVEYSDYLARWVASTAPGKTITLVWVRNEERHEARVALDESPDAAPQWSIPPDADSPPTRIADLQRRIQHLNTELKRLKADTTELR
jgi:predicted metalloprotease with PDZ domain